MLRFPIVEPRKMGAGGERVAGPDALINPEHVVAVEPYINLYNSTLPAQSLSTVCLSSGPKIDLFASVDDVNRALANAATR